MDVAARLRDTLATTYRVERELPAGGMSRVFLAEEIALGRLVVIKVLSPDLAAGVSADRFAREIRMAAQLQQANIVPLLSFGALDGLPYYTMPYVAGESLRHRLAAQGAFPVPQALGILRDVARALSYAHERGIVHRDIKPENVLLSGDAAVVTDFGIAKAINESRTMDAETITTTGTVVGTPAYIAPEQAAGDPAVDHRADFYAFGCLAYELFTGHPPFYGRTPQALLAAHLAEVPKPVDSIVPEVPPHVAWLVAQCLNKTPAERPQSAREILQVLDSVHSPVPAAQPFRSRPFDLDRRLAFAALALVALVGLGYAATRTRAGRSLGGAPHPKAVAVLPFTNSGGDSAEAYFAEGMADELIAALGKVPVLSVASRRSAFALKQRSDLDVPSIGRILHVDAVLEGTVRRAGDRLRVTAQLTSTSDGLTLWSESYERQLKDVFAVQDDITRSIVSALRLRLGTGQRPVTIDLSAYDDYLRGVYALERRSVKTSIELFDAAIRKDSSFARAYAKLSEALELLPYFSAVSASSVESRAIAAANRALALDSSAAEAHIGLALAMGHAFRWDDAEREYRLAIAGDTNSSVARTQYGRHLLNMARIPEAIEQFKRAVALDPLSGTPALWLAHSMSLIGNHDSALSEGRRARAVDPGLALAAVLPAMDLLAVGRKEEARRMVEGLQAGLPFRGQAGYVLAQAGNSAAAKAIIKEMLKLPDTTWLLHTALVFTYLGLRDTARALTELERAVRAKEITPKWVGFSDRSYDPIRKSRRFAAVVRAFGLDPKIFTASYGGRPAK